MVQNTSKSGYVPVDYVMRIEGPPLQAAPQAPNDHHRLPGETGQPEKAPTSVSRMGAIRRLSDPRLAQHLLETLDPAAGGSPPAGGGKTAATASAQASMSGCPDLMPAWPAPPNSGGRPMAARVSVPE